MSNYRHIILVKLLTSSTMAHVPLFSAQKFTSYQLFDQNLDERKLRYV